MLIPTITFEIRNFETNEIEEFLVLNTLENQEKIFSHRYTRNIKFTKTFEFQVEREMRMPLEFIDMDTWVALINSDPDLFASVAELTTV